MIRCPISRVALVTLLFPACSTQGPGPGAETPEPTTPMDVHSHASASPARIEHLDLDLQVDMTERRLVGKASYRIRPHGADTIFLDTDALEIDKVVVDGREVQVVLGERSILGRALCVPIDSNSTTIAVTYRTTEGARALQWLSPQQTADRTHPFLFTQGQAILTRTAPEAFEVMVFRSMARTAWAELAEALEVLEARAKAS